MTVNNAGSTTVAVMIIPDATLHLTRWRTVAVVITCAVIVAYVCFVHLVPLTVTRKIPLYTVSQRPTTSGDHMVLYRTSHDRYVNAKQYTDCYAEWLRLNPMLEIQWFSDHDCDRYMRDTQPAEVQRAYRSLKPGAFKADLFRLCILYDRGGMYVDAQAKPFVSIRSMLVNCRSLTHRFVSVLDSVSSPITGESSIHNGVLIAEAGHPFLRCCIDRIVLHTQMRDHTDSPLGVTGPLCLARAIRDCLHNRSFVFTSGLNEAGEMSFYLFRHQWGPAQHVYDGNRKLLCKKHCFLTYLSDKAKSTSYNHLWKKRDVFV